MENDISATPQGDQPSQLLKEAVHLTKLGLPILAVQMLQMSVIVIDTVMAGRYSTEDLSGVAIGGSIWFPTIVFLMGFITSLTPTVAQLHGAKRTDGIPIYVYQSLWMVMMILPVAVTLGLFIPSLLRVISADQAVQPIAAGYLHAMGIGLAPFLLYTVLRCFSEGLSLTKPAVTGGIIALLVNAPLNYVLIYGKFGMPELGGVGCGWASAISFYVMFFYMLWVVARKREYQAFGLFKRVYGVSKKHLRHLIGIGLPIGVAGFIESSMFGVVALFLASHGAEIVASHQIALNITTVVFMVPLSLSMALTIRTGFLVGSQHFRLARAVSFMGIGLALAYASVSASLLYFFRSDIVSLYNTQAEVVSLASKLLLFVAIFQLGDAIQVCAGGALRGYKDTRMTMVIMFVTFWCCGLPLGHCLSFTYLVEGYWMGLVAGLLAAGVLLMARLWRITSRRIDSASQTPPAPLIR